MNDNANDLRAAVTKTIVVVECTACDYRREFDDHSRNVSGAVAGHARSADCEAGAEVQEQVVLLCDSCGYEHGEQGAVVTATATDSRYDEDTLCNVCRAHRDERFADAVDWALGGYGNVRRARD